MAIEEASHEPTLPDTSITLFRALGDRQRRRILSILNERARPISEDDLAARLVAQEGGDRPDAPLGGERDPIRIDLHHGHLPKLEAAGLIEWNRNGVAPTDHWVYDESSPLTSSTGFGERDPSTNDRLFDRLADRYNRETVSILAERSGPITVDELAGRLARRIHAPEEESPAETVRRVRTSLHHNNLPTLADTGVIEYDPDRDTVVYRGCPEPIHRWLSHVGTLG